MLTVIITTDETSGFRQSFQHLFLPFEQIGEIAFCRWNVQGRDVKTALPELQTLIRAQTQWRAIIALPLSSDGTPFFDVEYPAKPENPFDYLCNRDVSGLKIEESQIPLVRLAQMLGGVPDFVYEYQDVMVETDGHAYRDTVLCSDLSQLEQQRAEWIRLEEQYAFPGTKPTELYLMVARHLSTIDQRCLMNDGGWQPKTEYDASRFCIRNRYPAKTRFLTMDCIPNNRTYGRGEEMRFWMTVLTLALNEYESARIMPERLCCVECELDYDCLRQAFSDRYNRLYRLERIIQMRAEKLRVKREEDKEQESLPAYGFEVAVSIPEIDSDGLYVDEWAPGLSHDCPESERHMWFQQTERSRKAFDRMLRAPRRSLDHACVYTRRNARIEDALVSFLDRYQLEDLERQLREEEIDLFNLGVFGALPIERVQRECDKAKREVQENINRRMSRMMTVGVGVTALVLYAGGYLPEIIRAVATGKHVAALCIGLVVRLGLVSIIGLTCITVFRLGLVGKMRNYNRVMTEIDTAIDGSCGFFGQYLSKLCTYMRGRSILDVLKRRHKAIKEENVNLEQHRVALERCRLQVATWLESLGMDICPDEDPGRMEYFNSDITPEENEAYDLQMARNVWIQDSQGEQRRLPYSFVKSVEIQREELFE